MPDLHAWITARVDRIEAIASDHGQWSSGWYYDDLASEIRDSDNRGTVAFVPTAEAGRHIAANEPEAVLRRCDTDRWILARHRADPGHPNYPACEGCGDTDCCTPATGNINDCPELRDLAHAHGINDEILAGLDRPEAPKGKRRPGILSLTWKARP